MASTPLSLLQRLRRPEDQAAWERFTDLYVPLLYHWARRLDLQPADAADLVQDVLAVVVRELPRFTYDPSRSFRAWLRTLLLNRWRTSRRRAPMAALVGEPAAPDPPDDLDETEYRRHLLQHALTYLRGEFSETFWRAFQEHALAGRPAEEVAAEIGIASGTVYVAKSRVLKRLREELRGLLD
jgi:RNA polymerase sigma-70 factor (ECF subfamily)